MWEQVEGKFYENRGKGSFVGSDEGGWRCRSIKSSGVEWIDTGVVGESGLEVTADVSYNGTDEIELLAGRLTMRLA